MFDLGTWTARFDLLLCLCFSEAGGLRNDKEKIPPFPQVFVLLKAHICRFKLCFLKGRLSSKYYKPCGEKKKKKLNKTARYNKFKMLLDLFCQNLFFLVCPHRCYRRIDSPHFSKSPFHLGVGGGRVIRIFSLLVWFSVGQVKEPGKSQWVLLKVQTCYNLTNLLMCLITKFGFLCN